MRLKALHHVLFYICYVCGVIVDWASRASLVHTPMSHYDEWINLTVTKD